VIGEVLATRGYSPFEGLVLTSLLAGMGISSLLVEVIGSRLSNRVLYVGLLLALSVPAEYPTALTPFRRPLALPSELWPRSSGDRAVVS
jgi:hypothetical protein